MYFKKQGKCWAVECAWIIKHITWSNSRSFEQNKGPAVEAIRFCAIKHALHWLIKQDKSVQGIKNDSVGNHKGPCEFNEEAINL